MIHYDNVTDAQKLCECLSSPVRVEILRLTLGKSVSSLDEIAKTLHLSNGAITQHIKKLCELGLIELVPMRGKHGTKKRCVCSVDRVIIDVAGSSDAEQSFDVPIGQFSSAQIKPYCGIASSRGWIGERDDPRYFSYPERASASLLYFNSGKITWTLPPPRHPEKLRAVMISLELSSKSYGYARERESLVDFFINEFRLGSYRIDGEFTDRRGLFTPSALGSICQYGKYKTLSVNRDGTFVDGIKIGEKKLHDLDLSAITFSLATDSGVAVFGSGCGDYGCGIRFEPDYGL